MLVRITTGLLIAVMCLQSGIAAPAAEPEKKASEPQPQYEFEKIVIPPARADEPVRAGVSVKDAMNHLEQGAVAWSKQKKCVTCHTNGHYMTVRPALTEKLGKPSDEIRTFLVDQTAELAKLPKPQLASATRPAQIVYIAAGLAEWDAHITKKLSPETVSALEMMFHIQKKSGEWGSLDCWPPYESSPFHVATVAAMAVATAPGWVDGLTDEKLKDSVARLKKYLRETPPPQDYDRMLLLWAATRMTDLVDATKKTELVENVWKHQRDDGGWSIRTFAKPEEWESGNRAEKLRAEPDFKNPASDAHQTAFSVVVLRDAGVPASDPRIQRAVTWIKSNQRESGRWWTRSLNTDTFHFITYSATGYSLLALEKCGELPAVEGVAAK